MELLLATEVQSWNVAIEISNFYHYYQYAVSYSTLAMIIIFMKQKHM